MAINRFEQPAQADFINTYVPIPFKEMMMAGQAKQQRYDQTLASANTQASAIGQIQAVPGSKDEITLAEINRNLEDVISKYSTGNIDLSNSVIKANFNREIKQAAPRDTLNKIASTYQGYVKDMTERTALNRTGNLAPDEMQFDFTGYDSLSESGVYSGLPTRRRNPDDFVRELFSEMKSDDMGYVVGKGIDVNGIPKGVMEKKTGVSDYRLQQQVINNVDSFVRSADGQYLINETKTFNPEEERSDKQIALDYLMAKRGEYTQGRSIPMEDPNFTSTTNYNVSNPYDFNILATTGTENVEGKTERPTNKNIAKLGKNLDKNIIDATANLKLYEPGDPRYETASIKLENANAAKDRFNVAEENIDSKMKDEFGERYDLFKQKAIDNLMKSGKYESSKEAEKELISFLTNEDGLESAIKQYGFKELIVLIPNLIEGVKYGSSKLKRRMAAGLTTAIQNKDDRYMTRSEFVTEMKIIRDQIPEISTESFIRPGRKGSIKKEGLDYLFKALKLQKESKDHKQTLNNIYHYSSASNKYQVALPVKEEGDNFYIVDGEGKKIARSKTGYMIKDAFNINPENHDMTVISGKVSGRKKNKKDNLIDVLPEYKVLGTTPQLRFSKDNSIITTTTLTPKDTDSKKDNLKIEITWHNEGQRQNFVNDYYIAGATKSAIFMAKPELGTSIDRVGTTEFSSGDGHEIEMNANVLQDKVTVKLVNGMYIVKSNLIGKSIPALKEVEAENTEVVKSILYEMLQALYEIEASQGNKQ